MSLPHLHLPGNLTQMIPRIASQFGQPKKMVAVGVKGFAGCKLE